MNRYEPPTSEVLDLSQYIYDRLSALGAVEAIKMQKLLYYCKAWSLATLGHAIFPDKIQAWKHGPVVASLYPLHRGKITLEDWRYGNAKNVAPTGQKIANAVINVYGGLTGWELRDLTHTETPWKDAWNKSDQGSTQGVVIEDEAMKTYYSSKLGK